MRSGLAPLSQQSHGLQAAYRKLIAQQEELGSPSNRPGSDGAAGDEFGCSIAMDGPTAVVGACKDDRGGLANAGSAYVFVRSGDVWQFQAKLAASTTSADASFGYSVAVHDDLIAVGAPFDSSEGQLRRGAAFVFRRTGETWALESRVLASDGLAGDVFGVSVAVSVDALLVGASGDDVNGQGDRGSVYAFVPQAGNWSQQSKLVTSDAVQMASIGYSLALDGDVFVVGSGRPDGTGVLQHGSAYVFTRDAGTWRERTRLTRHDPEEYDYFGAAVDLDGDKIVVGAPGYDFESGAAYVFVGSGSSWTQQAKLEASDASIFQQFGRAVAIAGERVMVGSPGDRTIPSIGPGAVYEYQRVGVQWSQHIKLALTLEQTQDGYGAALAMDGPLLLVGLPGDDHFDLTDRGSVQAFERTSTVWLYRGRVSSGVGSFREAFGHSVAVWGDTAVVGAPYADVVGSVNRGAAYVFAREDGDWVLQTILWSPDADGGDLYGIAVALQDNVAFIGATGAGLGTDAFHGAVYVFVRDAGEWYPRQILNGDAGADVGAFGSALAVSGDLLLVGAAGSVVQGETNRGEAFVFRRSTGGWVREARLSASDGAPDDHFGASVSLTSEGVAVVGAPSVQFLPNAGPGAAYVFRGGPAGWVEEARLFAGPGRLGDFFGADVAAHGTTIAVGAPGEDVNATNRGTVHVFEQDAGGWQHSQSLHPPDQVRSGKFGSSLAMRQGVLLVGAPGSKLEGVYNPGAIYAFTRADSSWEASQKFSAANPLNHDLFGADVAIWQGTALVGAPGRIHPTPEGHWDDGAAFVLAGVSSPPSVAAPDSIVAVEDGTTAPIEIVVGDLESDVSSLILQATSSDTQLISNESLALGLGGSGSVRTLAITPRPDRNGVAHIELRVTDSDGASQSKSVTVVVQPVNDPPTAEVGGQVCWSDGEIGGRTLLGALVNITPGPDDELDQQLAFEASIWSDPADILSSVEIDSSGALHYILTGRSGVAEVAMFVTDSGGVALGGSDRSEQALLVISVGGADLRVQVQSAASTKLLRRLAAAPSLAEYDIQVLNLGPLVARNVSLDVLLPVGLNNVLWGCSAPAGCDPDVGSGMVNTTFDLDINQFATARLIGEIDPDVPFVEITAQASLMGCLPLLNRDDDRLVFIEPSGPDGMFKSGFE